MQTISLVSIHAGTGKTTIAVNAAKGLQRKGYRVIVHNIGQKRDLYEWLSPTQTNGPDELISETDKGKPAQILTTPMEVDMLLDDTKKSDLTYYNETCTFLEQQGYDYLILDTDSGEKSMELAAALGDMIIACSDLSKNDEAQQLAKLNRVIETRSRQQKGINLIVPCKVNPQDWTNNSQVLFSIADRVGYENIADMIPRCERIHLLACDHKHVWDLPHFKNVQKVFDNLVSRLEMS